MPPGPTPPRPCEHFLPRRVSRPLLGGGGDPPAVGHRRPGRRIGLGVVVQLDDLDRVEERRGQLGAAHHQHRRDREVRHHGAVRCVVATELVGKRLEVLVRQASRAHHGVDSVHGQPQHGAPCCVGDREVDDHLGARIHERLRLAETAIPSIICPAAYGSTAATRSSSGSSATAAHTADPIRPPAPLTPTRMWGEYGLGRRERADQHGHRSTCPVHPVDDAPHVGVAHLLPALELLVDRDHPAHGGEHAAEADMRAPVSSSPIS